MSRRDDRKHLFSLIFQIEFYDEQENWKERIDLYFSGLENSNGIDKTFVEKGFYGVLENKQEIDNIINKYSEGWEIKRLSKADLGILRLCVYEMKYAEGIPDGVAINEAVELSKSFALDESPAFVNGILGKVSKEVDKKIIT